MQSRRDARPACRFPSCGKAGAECGRGEPPSAKPRPCVEGAADRQPARAASTDKRPDRRSEPEAGRGGGMLVRPRRTSHVPEHPATASRSRVARVERRRVSAAIRWDRISRYGLLAVLVGMLFLYVNPARSYLDTLRESHHRRAEVRGLLNENKRLQAKRRALDDPHTLEAAARKLGMVRPGERPYVVRGLPRGG